MDCALVASGSHNPYFLSQATLGQWLLFIQMLAGYQKLAQVSPKYQDFKTCRYYI